MTALFAIVVPYAALAIFLAGIVWRVLGWSRAPVPFRIPVTCGQQRSLPWIRHARLENPATGIQAAARVTLEVLAFRSLWRNQEAGRAGRRLYYDPSRTLAIAALSFHWSLLVIVIRHLRLFLSPAPRFIPVLSSLDGFFQLGMPVVYITDIAVAAALLYLIGRRLLNARLRYLSLASDYVSLGLLLTVAGSGLLLRYVWRTDIAAVKQYALSLAAFSPRPPADAGILFYAHITAASLLLAWFPFSKLVHMADIFLSPTRNLANNSRARRHGNPWNYPVPVHTYEEWEDEFREKIKAAGLPLEKS